MNESKIWMVPKYDIISDDGVWNSDGASAGVSHTNSAHVDEGCSECEEAVELNDVWAARFSKTIKRMKQKAHKAKRRAMWTPKR